MTKQGLNRRAAKRDKNEREIIDALTQIGATVEPLSKKGVPDLLVGFRGEDFKLEVKGKGEKLTSHEAEWHIWWCGKPPVVVKSVEDAFRAIGATE